MSNKGWIKLYRQFLDWEWYGDINTRLLAIHLLLKVNPKESKWQGAAISKGSCITSIESLAEEVGLTCQMTRTALRKLKLSGFIEQKSTNKFTMLTICKYRDYQGVLIAEQQTTNKQLTNEQQTTNKQLTTDKEYKEVKNINISNTNVSDIQKKESSNFEISLKANPEGKVKSSTKKDKFKQMVMDSGVSESTTNAWIEIRQGKHAVFTAKAWALTINEITKSGLTPQQAIDECIIRNWQGFKADWILREYKTNPPKKNEPFQQSKTTKYDDKFE